MSEILIVVPCRAGSVEIPRKSTQIVDGKPLVCRTLDMLHEVGEYTAHELTVVVSTDDPVVIELARQHGVLVQERSAELCMPDVPLHRVVSDVTAKMAWSGRVGCAQVTSPFLSAQTVAEMLDVFAGSSFNTASTVVPENDLRWVHDLDDEKRDARLHGDAVSRQSQATITERETGGLRLWNSPASVTTSPLGGSKHLRWTVSEIEGIDIDTPEDLHRARDAAKRRRILFVIEASMLSGSGHLHRCLALIDHLTQHHIEVCFTDDAPDWAWDAIEAHGGIADAHGSWTAMPLRPGAFDAVVFDKLDTTTAEVAMAKAIGAGVVTLEDLGPGTALADFVINELYPGGPTSGPAWSVLRPEFHGPPTPRSGEGKVLVTFGGTDPSGLNERFAAALAGEHAGKLTVVVPSTRRVADTLDGVVWVNTTMVPMAALMRQADVVVTSCGRTVTEAMAMGRPVVSVAANLRELSHFHHEGVAYLGPHWSASDDQVRRAVAALLGPVGDEIGEVLRGAVPRDGAERIAGLVGLAAKGTA